MSSQKTNSGPTAAQRYLFSWNFFFGASAQNIKYKILILRDKSLSYSARGNLFLLLVFLFGAGARKQKEMHTHIREIEFSKIYGISNQNKMKHEENKPK